MLLSLLLVVLLFAIAFFQASQGWFSALIMAVFTICSATAALGSYEWVAVNFLAPHWKPDYAYAVALAALFGIPLLILRAVTDKLVRRNVLLPAMIDRIGGGVCGLISAVIVIGVLAHALQMIPFENGRILGYARIAVPHDDDSTDAARQEEEPEERELMLQPDRVAVGAASMLSAGVFSGAQVFGYATPDLVQAVGWVNAVPAEVSRFAPPGSISIQQAVSVPFVYQYTEANSRSGTAESFDAEPPSPGHEFLMVAVKLANSARDERRSFVFSLRQFRLAGQQGGEGPYEQFHAIAIRQADATQATNRHVRSIVRRSRTKLVTDEVLSPQDSKVGLVEVVFEIPEGFVPQYLEYKRGARAQVSVSQDRAERPVRRAQPPDEAAPSTTVAKVTPSDSSPGDESAGTSRRRSRRRSRASNDNDSAHRGGNVRGVTTRLGRSTFGDELPVPMKSYRRLKNVEIRNDKLTSGHLVGEFDGQADGRDPPVRRFDVPRDKRLLQLHTSRLQTRSFLGGALDLASSTVQNYFVEDLDGNHHKIVGKCAVADVNGTRFVEVQYFRDPIGTIGGPGKFDKIKKGDLKGDYELILLFLVDPGVEIVSFQTGGSATRADDLRGENLIAPK